MTTILPQTGFVVWMTGLPTAGKSTAAKALQTLLAKRGIPSLILDTDELRPLLTPSSNHTVDESEWLYGVIAQWAAWLAKQGQNVLIAATANERRYRDTLRHMVPHFTEVYLFCDSEIEQERLRENNLLAFTGVYEPPIAAEITIDTSNAFPDETAYKIFLYLRKQPYLA